MIRDLEPATAAGALYNLLVERGEYGRATFVAERFSIPRRTVYRLEERFRESLARGPGRPRSTPTDVENQRLQERLAALEQENEQLRAQLQQERQDAQTRLERMKFFALTTGLPSRVAARGVQEVFEAEASHTHLLELTRHYGRRATAIMQEYFWPCARDVDLDELFIEDLPLLLAGEPQSLAILKASLEEERSQAVWAAFLDGLPNVERATCDRGKGLVAAVTEKNLVHQSDVFHPKRLLATELRKMEKRCYKLIAAEYQAEEAVQKAKAQGRDARKPAQQYRRAREEAERVLDRFEELEQAVALAFQALRLTTTRGTLNSPSQARDDLEVARLWIDAHFPPRLGQGQERPAR